MSTITTRQPMDDAAFAALLDQIGAAMGATPEQHARAKAVALGVLAERDQAEQQDSTAFRAVLRTIDAIRVAAAD